MNKVIVIGCPGSGKSTFARKLHEKSGLPLHYLDIIWWKADKTTISAEEFDIKLEEILAQDRWIIDGNYNRTLEKRISFCDTVFFLDMPVEVCVEGIRKRVGVKRADMPWIEESVDEEFLNFVQKFNEHTRPGILRLLKSCLNKNVVIFTSQTEIEKYLANKNTVSI